MIYFPTADFRKVCINAPLGAKFPERTKLLTGLLGPFIAEARKGDHLNVKKKRRMKVYELGGKSMIRITGDCLSEVFGYRPGDEIEVELCKDGSIRIQHSDYANYRELPNPT